ncbi:MAG TPA: chromosome segregation protein SMC [Nitrospirales bacterium]
MHLKRLEMNGFKSFVEAQIIFQQGITAVVGPNGSGKSNILDAILWVLGEQSTKTLRSERMEDVIFNGTESRKPQGMVEVSLILGEVDGTRPGGEPDRAFLPYSLGEYQEIMVTRRLFRDGVSEYFINQTPCRLKDLRGLLLDTRAGSKGHTVIEQGMIDRLLKASPIERRELIEETAGIIRYKKQKTEALRKLEATNQNLSRVRDIVNEVKRQLGSLERQAKAAEAYQALREEVRRLELIVLIHEHQEISGTLRHCERSLLELGERESAENAAAARLDTEVEAGQLQLIAGDTAIAEWRDEVAQLEGRLGQAATAIELSTQRACLLEEQRVRVEADLAQVQTEKLKDAEDLMGWADRGADIQRELSATAEAVAGEDAALKEAVQCYRESQAALEVSRSRAMDRAMAASIAVNQVTNNQARAAELSRRTEKSEQQRIQAEAAFDSLRQQLRECQERRRHHEIQLQETVAAVRALAEGMADLKKRLSDAGNKVAATQEELAISTARQRALQAITRGALESLADSESLGATLAHVLTVRSEYDVAIEAVLGHKLIGMLIDAPQDAARLLKTFQGQGSAAVTFLPKRPRIFRADHPLMIYGEGIVGPALDFVSPLSGYEELTSHLLGGVVIVQTLDDAVALWQGMTESAYALLVTVNGEILEPDGAITASPADAAVGVFARERELRALTDRVQGLEHALQEAKETRDELEHALAGETERWEMRDSEARRREMDLIGERTDEQRCHQDLAQLRERIQVLMAECQASEAEREALLADELANRNDLQRLETERASAEAALAELQHTVAENEGVVERRHASTGEVRLRVAGLTERLEQTRAEIRRMESVAAVRETRILELQGEVMRLREACATALLERQAAEAGIPAIESELFRARRTLSGAQEAQAELTTRLRALDAEFNKLRHGIEALHREQEAVRLSRREAEIRLEGYEGQLRGTYQVSLETAIAQVGDREDAHSARERLIQRRGRLEELGPVNVMAIEEHRELEERLRFLTTQEEDLAQSVASLRTIISKINRTTKELFLNTFQELQSKFDEMFRNFFEGGRAELLLVEDEEGGEPGVDIVAQPPGKRLKNITMLSGGERALTAMALVFASFIIRPTPFCVLDEIDAPLDEENTGRFTRVLQGLSARSQFIVITHSKQTMEVADSLYGVTMEEPGISTLVSVRLNRMLEPV